MKTKYNVRINRDKWLRGETNGNSCLWNNYMDAGCCLGHAIKQTHHYSEDRILNNGTPETIFSKESFYTILRDSPWDGGKIIDNKDWVSQAIEINDDEEISDCEREKRLTGVFKTAGIQLEFYN